MKLTIDSIILVFSFAVIGVLGYLIVSTCWLYRTEYDRGCWNGAAQVCAGGNCPDTIFMNAYHKCLEGKNR